MEIKILEDLDPLTGLGLAWENLVKNNAASGIMQSLAWSNFKRRQGLKSLHLGIFEDNCLIGGVIFYTGKNNKGAGIMIAPEGPVLPWQNEKESETYLQALIDRARLLSKDLQCIGLRIEPRIESPGYPSLISMPRSPVDLIPRETLYLDLNYSEEDLLARMKPKGRYNIRLSQKKNLLLEEGCKPNQIRDFYRVLQEASRRDDFLLEPFAFFVNLIDTLQAANSIKLFLVRHEDSLLGSLLLTTYGQRATYLYGGISNQKRNLMAGYALQWAAIKAAQNADCRTYDFYGFDRFGRPDHNYARFSRFKKQFGGSAINFIGGRDLYFNERLADAVVNVFKNANVMTSFR